MVKCSKIDAEDVCSDLQNDSRIDIVVDSSDTALDKSEIEVIQVNNGACCAPATSESMDAGMTDESEIMDKGNSDTSETRDTTMHDVRVSTVIYNFCRIWSTSTIVSTIIYAFHIHDL